MVGGAPKCVGGYSKIPRIAYSLVSLLSEIGVEYRVFVKSH